MKTKHLDNEIERLNLMERTEDLSEYGQDMLNEFREIKQALNIPVVSKCYTEKDLDNAYDKGFNDGNQRDLTGSLIEVL
jgi:hypothetical protein